jgi:PASTA domain
VKTIRVAALPALVLLGAACLGSTGAPSVSRPKPPGTDLRIVYVRDVLTSGHTAHRRSAPLTLRCSPPGGTLPNPAVACFAIEHSPGRYLGHGAAGCFGPLFRWAIHVTGTFRGQPVRRTYDMCAIPEARAWTDLGGTPLVGIVPARSLVTVPRAAPGYVAPAVAALHADGLRTVIPSVPAIHAVDASTNGYAVVSQTPARGARVPRGTLVVLRVGVSVNGGPGGLGPAGTVPQLSGVDVNRAIGLATSQGLRVTVGPPGHPVAALVVTGQSIDPGAAVTEGETIVLTLG